MSLVQPGESASSSEHQGARAIADLADRLVVLNSLAHAGLTIDEAERWCDLWVTEALRQGRRAGPGYWDEGRDWIDRQRAKEAEGPASGPSLA